MVETGDLAFTLVVVVVLEGVWLAGLTYMMWRRYLARKRAEAQGQPPDQTDKTHPP